MKCATMRLILKRHKLRLFDASFNIATSEAHMTYLPSLSMARQIAATIITACAISGSHAQPATEQLHQRATAAMCANCHGTEGRTVEGSAIPALAGMSKDYHVQQMQAFKNGTRPATVMHQITKGLTDAQIDTMASYFASIKR
jgi:cytochrome subunit of sulfide dehydrogenase